MSDMLYTVLSVDEWSQVTVWNVSEDSMCWPSYNWNQRHYIFGLSVCGSVCMCTQVEALLNQLVIDF